MLSCGGQGSYKCRRPFTGRNTREGRATRRRPLYGIHELSSNQGSCAVSRAHTYRNPGRNYSHSQDTDTSSAPSNLANNPHNSPSPRRYFLTLCPPPLPLLLQPAG